MKLGVISESWLKTEVRGCECTAATCLYFFGTRGTPVSLVGVVAGFDPFAPLALFTVRLTAVSGVLVSALVTVAVLIAVAIGKV